ncbi:MAG: ABC transporter permease [Acidimicrobiales bacterium]
MRLSTSFRVVVLGILGLFFLLPIVASARFSFVGNHGSLTISAYTQLFSTPEFWTTLWLSVRVAVGSVFLTLVLLVPTVVWIHLRLPRLRRTFESISLLPLVIPSVVVTLGVITTFKHLPNVIIGTPIILALEYVVLALPYTYRSIDAAVQAVDLVTLVDAARSLGSSWWKLLFWVLLPSFRSGILAAALLAFAFGIGEFAVASLLSFTTFPVFLVQVGQTAASQAVALSLIALVFTWLPLAAIMLGFGRRRAVKSTAAVPGSLAIVDLTTTE